MTPNGWDRHPVGKLCKSIVPGRNKPKKFDGDIAWITTPDIQGRYVPSNVQQHYISEDAIIESGAKVIPAGSVIIAAVGELGLTAIASEPLVLNQQLHAFVCPEFLDNEFLAYWFETQKPYMERIASKTTIPYMNKSNCESIPVSYPPLPEQKKIVQILSTWDKAIETVEKLIENSQQKKKALMQQLLTGKKRFPAFDGEWKEHLLGDLGYTYSGLSGKNKAHFGSGKPFIPYMNIFNNSKIDVHCVEKVMISANESQSKAKYGDIFFTTSSETPEEVGMSSVLLDDVGELYLNSFCFGFRLHHFDILSPEFASFLFRGAVTRQAISTLAQGATRYNLSKKQMLKITLSLPSVEEQQRISTVLSSADQEIETWQQELAHLKQEKKSLMQQLLTGKKRVAI